MDISRRLKMVAAAVTKGNRVADIGTDHGYVPIFLIKQGACAKALAMDINAGPLERAVEHIAQEGLTDQIVTRLSDGMMQLEKGEADTAVIAGMGGDLICRILNARKDLLEDGIELVLQPQSEWFKVRHALHDLGYQILQEWFLKEDGKYYVILKAKPGKQNFEEEYQYAYGDFLEEDCRPVLEEYLKKEIKKREEISAGLRSQMDNLMHLSTNTEIDAQSNSQEDSQMNSQVEKNEKKLSVLSQRVEELHQEIQLLKKRWESLES